jgi:hypothetical protein
MAGHAPGSLSPSGDSPPARQSVRNRLPWSRGSVLAAATLAAVLAPALGAADEPDAQQKDDAWKRDRFYISLGAFWPNVDTTLRLDSPTTGNQGTVLDMENDLGLPDREALGIGSFNWRMARRHTLDFGYFNLARSGSTTLQADIQWGDEGFTTVAEVDSFFDTEVYRLAYFYSPIQREKISFFFGGGFYVMNLDVGISDQNPSGLSTSTGLTAPLPVIALGFNYRFYPKWNLGLALEFFDIKIQDIQGRLLNAGGEVGWRTWEHVGFAFGYKYFDVAIEADEPDFQGIADYRYWGPTVQVTFAW